MAITDALLPEFDHEMGTLRRVFDRVPDAQLAWRPHAKSMSMGELCAHLANIPFWCTATLRATSLDLDTIADGARPAPPSSRTALLKTFDEQLATAREHLSNTTDAELMAPWTLMKGDQKFFTMPRVMVLRTFVLNHLIHHRGQLSVYLRLNDVPVPPIYGPTADEQ
jgi:uncharacterized damage-inducible protein DinB